MAKKKTEAEQMVDKLVGSGIIAAGDQQATMQIVSEVMPAKVERKKFRVKYPEHEAEVVEADTAAEALTKHTKKKSDHAPVVTEA